MDNTGFIANNPDKPKCLMYKEPRSWLSSPTVPKKNRRTANASAFEIVSNHTAGGPVFPFGHDTALFTLSGLDSALKALKVSRRLVRP